MSRSRTCCAVRDAPIHPNMGVGTLPNARCGMNRTFSKLSPNLRSLHTHQFQPRFYLIESTPFAAPPLDISMSRRLNVDEPANL